MKAIILAAGRGHRFGGMTDEIPKCMLNFVSKSILCHQIDTFLNAGVTDIAIVKGYLPDKILSAARRSYINTAYADTNMLYSLFCAKQELTENVIISYADIIYENALLCKLLGTTTADIAVVVDTNWKEYYQQRYGDPFREAESLVLSSDHTILEIGRSKPREEDIQGQYIGLIRLNSSGCKFFKDTYAELVRTCTPEWKFRGRSLKDAYMTDFLQILINKGITITAIPVSNGWLEFDSVSDYDLAIRWYETGVLSRFYRDPV
ncbi:CTP:phosphoglutamine cytidylyltransferase [subsurface metagenome]